MRSLLELTPEDIDAAEYDFICWKWTGSAMQLQGSIVISLPPVWWCTEYTWGSTV